MKDIFGDRVIRDAGDPGRLVAKDRQLQRVRRALALQEEFWNELAEAVVAEDDKAIALAIKKNKMRKR